MHHIEDPPRLGARDQRLDSKLGTRLGTKYISLGTRTQVFQAPEEANIKGDQKKA